mmetsp:Transcript_1439/g.3650  ORF Transcript_1439/g.3650 Transcript_1439/m.3650 type:complete len:192 (-) Transcript_1439:17-592(-)
MLSVAPNGRSCVGGGCQFVGQTGPGQIDGLGGTSITGCSSLTTRSVRRPRRGRQGLLALLESEHSVYLISIWQRRNQNEKDGNRRSPKLQPPVLQSRCRIRPLPLPFALLLSQLARLRVRPLMPPLPLMRSSAECNPSNFTAASMIPPTYSTVPWSARAGAGAKEKGGTNINNNASSGEGGSAKDGVGGGR